MPSPLSNDLRKRIIKKYEENQTPQEISVALSLSLSVVYKIISQYRTTGTYAPKPLNNGRKPYLSEEQIEAIKTEVGMVPDITLQELKEKLELPVGISGLCKILKKLKLNRKKRPYSPKNNKEKT